MFVAILAHLLFGKRTSPLSFAGILAALASTAVIGATFGWLDDFSGERARPHRNRPGRGLRPDRALFANRGRRGLALLGGGVLSRRAPAEAPILDVLLWRYSGEAWFWLWATTLGPQIMGHAIFDWALRYVEAPVLSGTILAEPDVSALPAWLIPSEGPGVAAVVGGVVVLSGLYLLL